MSGPPVSKFKTGSIAAADLTRPAEGIGVDLLRLVRTDEVGLYSYSNFVNYAGARSPTAGTAHLAGREEGRLVRLLCSLHLLIRDAVANRQHPDQHARLARAFDHKRMKDASTALLKEIGNLPPQAAASADNEQASHFRLSTVAQAVVDLQEARHKADYDAGEPFGPDAAADVAQARLAFVTWAEVRDEPPAQRYLYSLPFKEKDHDRPST